MDYPIVQKNKIIGAVTIFDEQIDKQIQLIEIVPAIEQTGVKEMNLIIQTSSTINQNKQKSVAEQMNDFLEILKQYEKLGFIKIINELGLVEFLKAFEQYQRK